MKIDINCPEIAALRIAVEKKFGCPVRSPRYFRSLSFEIEENLKEYLSETTLQRLWQYKVGYSTVAIHTLNVLCRYAGLSDWESFCENLKQESNVESFLFEGESVDVAQLQAGTMIRIGWCPDRICIIKYLGNYRFEAIETHNSKLCAGDTFTCMKMQKGRELFLDNLIRGNADMSYAVGTNNGLTTLEILTAPQEALML